MSSCRSVKAGKDLQTPTPGIGEGRAVKKVDGLDTTIYTPVTASRRATEINCRHDEGFALDPQPRPPNSEATRCIFKYKQPVNDHL